MKKILTVKSWGIYENNKKEVEKFGFEFSAVCPDNMECGCNKTPSDSEWEFNTIEQAILFAKSADY